MDEELDKELKKVKEVFPLLSKNAKGLLISMVHPSYTGMELEGVEATSSLEGEDLNRAIEELRGYRFWETGRLEKGVFIPGEGKRHRLPEDIKKQVVEDILRLKENSF